MGDLQRNISFFRKTNRVQLARVVILIALVVSGCGTRQAAPATEQAAETPEPQFTITSAPASTATPLPPSPAPTRVPVVTQVSSKDGMVLVFIPAGTFLMGSESGSSDEQPVHTVTLDAFWMDQTEVTNAMYALCVADGDCSPPQATRSNTRSSDYGEAAYADYPVINVNWNQAAAYCDWAGRELPTEAQWEYAARGGLAEATYPWGNESPSCVLGVWNGALYGPCSPDDTTVVGSFAPNGYGLYDMAGNVWEWVADWYGPYSSAAVVNPSGPVSGDYHVLRGGAWNSYESSLRVSIRRWNNPVITYNYLGFRCASSP